MTPDEINAARHYGAEFELAMRNGFGEEFARVHGHRVYGYINKLCRKVDRLQVRVDELIAERMNRIYRHFDVDRLEDVDVSALLKELRGFTEGKK